MSSGKYILKLWWDTSTHQEGWSKYPNWEYHLEIFRALVQSNFISVESNVNVTK